jgi:hypothetical protein
MKRFLFASVFLVFLAVSGRTQSNSGQKPDSAKPAATTKKKLQDDDLKGFDVSDAKSVGHTAVGATRGDVKIPSAKLLAPPKARLYGASALFQWAPIGPTDGYMFYIVDDDQTQLVRQKVTDPNFRISDLGKLKPGETYSWKVQSLPSTVPGEPLEIAVVGGTERQKIARELAAISGDSFDAGFARARVFVAHKLWFDAIGAYTDLIAKFPDRAQPYEDRGAIYSQLEATKKRGEADLAKAATLK